MKKYQNYVFDLYGTLVDIHTQEDDPEVWEKLALFYGYYGAEYTASELQKSYEQLVNADEQVLKNELEAQPRYAHEAFPEIQIEQVFAELFEKKGVRADAELATHAGQFFRVLTTEYVRVYEGVEELLTAIHAAGGKLYLLSNAQRIFTEYEMRYLGIHKYFDGILISSDYKTKKPDIRFYDVLKEKYAVDPKESIMIGNDATSDIAGGRAAGMDTYYIHSNISPECETPPEATYCQMEMDLERVRRVLGV